eukprot:TRINITY_DN423_c0_g1_i2.p1 TRINITY_DN423_c0_g1~~TRINITY_DN423_c0_g1_i2.p1  ORF type:complete len:275 (-),score=-16.01 TRINITY_DN423_c0_g1_i2:37-861(-)
MKKKIVIIGAGVFQKPIIKKANELGYETHVFAWKEDAIAQEDASYFYPISITEKEEILKECKRIKPSGVISIASDLAMLTVNYVAQKLSLPCNDSFCTLSTTNKYKMRQVLSENNVDTPIFFIAYEKNINLVIEDVKTRLKKGNSFIVKPVDRSGSRGITKVEDIKDIKSAIKSAIGYSFAKGAIVEEYIRGEEYSLETITFKGDHEFLAVTKKFTTGAPCFIETGHIEPSGLSKDVIDKAKQIVFNALNALGVTNGASPVSYTHLTLPTKRIV